ncbi:hypothetical protein ACFFIO_09545 [Citricoccus parietis]|uniref:Uncharacterized protein n=1 Tax=Citricoccus parietis TaxID=592307 RepID=A0ABV6F605_9MICC
MTTTAEELHETIAEGQRIRDTLTAKASKIQPTKAEAEKIADAEAARDELAEREQAEVQRVRAREYHWADWFIRKGGYEQTSKAAAAERTDAEKALREALDNDPVYQAMARYKATGDYGARLYDLRERAVSALGLQQDPRGYPANGFSNYTEPSRTIEEHQKRRATDAVDEWYDALHAAVDAHVRSHDDTLPEALPTPGAERLDRAQRMATTEAEFRARVRIEETATFMPVPNGWMSRKVRVLHDLENGETLPLDDPKDAESGVFGYVFGDEFVPLDDLTPAQIEVAEQAVKQNDPGRYWRIHRPN